MEPVAQVIDSRGKTYGLSFSEGISMIVELRAPLILPELPLSESTVARVLSFCEKWKYAIISKTISEDELKGVWVSGPLYGGFIPIDSNHPESIREMYRLEKYETTTENPYAKPKKSILKHHRLEKKIAEILKSLTLTKYGEIIRNSDEKAKIGMESFLIDPRHSYGETGDGVFIKQTKIVVTSEDIAQRLINYATATYLTSPNQVVIPGGSIVNRYQSIDDFRKRPEQLLFMSKETLRYYQIDTSSEEGYIHAHFEKLFDESEDPFIYRGMKFNYGSPLIIQKVLEGRKDLAESVGKYWEKYQINAGFRFSIPENEIDDEKASFTLYNLQGEVISKYGRGNLAVNLLFYRDQYAAMFYL